MSREFAVVFCVDRNMFFPAIVVAEEAAAVPGADRYDVILIADKGSVPTEFAEWHRARGATFQIAEVDFSAAIPGAAITSDRLPAAAFFRLCLTKYFGDRYRRLLYVDGDTQIRSSISQIFDIEMRGKAVGAADDLGLSPLNKVNALLIPDGARVRTRLNLAPHQKYANSGVLLIDPEEWEGQSLTERTLRYAAAFGDRCALGDQDALNAILGGDFLVLSPRWNYSPALMRTHSVAGIFDPIIVHYYTGPKPWWAGYWDGDPAAAERYRRFFKDSPWPTAPHQPDWLRPITRGQSPQDWRSWTKALERSIRSLRRRLLETTRGMAGNWAPRTRGRRLIETYLNETAFADADLAD